MRKYIIILLFFLAILAAPAAWGKVPKYMSLQARITKNGVPPVHVRNLQYTFDKDLLPFRNAIFSYRQETGIIDATFEVEDEKYFSSTNVWISYVDDYGATVALPPQRLASVPYAFCATMADAAVADLKAANSGDQYQYGWLGGKNALWTGAVPSWWPGIVASIMEPSTGQFTRAGAFGQVENGWSYGYLGHAFYVSSESVAATPGTIFGLYAYGGNHYLRGSAEVNGNLLMSYENSSLMPSGRVGIVREAPEACLDINGLAGMGGAMTIQRNEGSYADTKANLFVDSSSGAPGLRIRTSSNNGTSWKDSLFLENTGNVGIGTAQPGGKKLNVNGSAESSAMSIGGEEQAYQFSGLPYILYVAGDAYSVLGWSSGSDLRWKKDIRPIQGPLDKTVQLQPVNYEWRANEFPDKGFRLGPQVGLIAQDVEKVMPELVSADRSGYKALAYGRLNALLIGAVKELKAEQDVLKAELEALKRKIK